jgi:hypothetical protein
VLGTVPLDKEHLKTLFRSAGPQPLNCRVDAFARTQQSSEVASTCLTSVLDAESGVCQLVCVLNRRLQLPVTAPAGVHRGLRAAQADLGITVCSASFNVHLACYAAGLYCVLARIHVAIDVILALDET